MKVQVSVPGKLYLAGEYAVVEAGYPAVVAAVDQYLTVTVESSLQGMIYSSQQDIEMAWIRKEMVIEGEQRGLYDLILSAMNVAENVARMQGKPTDSTYRVLVESQLDNQGSATKYGLGSSGAVTVATIKAVLAYYGISIGAYRSYQLAVMAQIQLGMAGSFGDLAASSFGGVVAYTSLDRDWLQELLAQYSLTEILEMPWKDVKIERLQLPKPLEWLIGWTGQAASTADLVAQVEHQQAHDHRGRARYLFLEKSQTCVKGLIQACREKNIAVFQKKISENRKLLQEFAADMGIIIETPQLHRLCQLAEQEGAVAKSSGAGGGDCGICFAVNSNQKERIYQKWQEAGIVPLPFAIAEEIDERSTGSIE